jgi:hypothetical protein
LILLKLGFVTSLMRTLNIISYVKYADINKSAYLLKQICIYSRLLQHKSLYIIMTSFVVCEITKFFQKRHISKQANAGLQFEFAVNELRK